MNKKIVFLLLIVSLLAIANVVSAVGFGGTITMADGINCTSGKVFYVTKRGPGYSHPFWVSADRKMISSGKKIIGVARSTNNSVCSRQSGQTTIPVTVYSIDNYGVSR